MSIDEIRTKLLHRPFEPFAIELVDGDVEHIDTPERILVLKTKIVIASKNSDRFRAISVFDIACAPERIAS